MATDSEIFEKHLRYELDMLIGTFELLEGSAKITTQEGQDVTEKITTNALIESFCIHARSLDHFFSTPTRSDDATATTYTTDSYERPNRDKGWRELIHDVNKKIARLTKLRTSDEKKKVGTEERRKLVQTLVADVHEFKKHLRTEFDAAILAHYQVPKMMIQPAPANTTSTIEGRITPTIFRRT